MPVEGGRTGGGAGSGAEGDDVPNDPLLADPRATSSGLSAPEILRGDLSSGLLVEMLSETFTESGSLSAEGLSAGDLPLQLGNDLRVVTARGTEHGLILRIDGRSDWTLVRNELDNFLGGRKKFFEGGEVSIEWIDRLPSPEQAKELGEYLLSQYGLKVVTRRRRFSVEQGSQSGASGANLASPNNAPASSNSANSLNTASTINLFQDLGGTPERPASDRSLSDRSGEERLDRESFFVKAAVQEYAKGAQNSGSGSSRIDRSSSERERAQGREGGARGMFDEEFGSFGTPGTLHPGSLQSSLSSPKRVASQMAKILGGPDLMYEDEANAKILFGTLRSGQRVETPFSLIIIGDVNPGADLVAGGDIIVLGSLRGTAQASAYDDESFDRVIIALHMQPMQLRIGSVLSRGSEEVVRGAEIARIENRRIVVEAFNPRMLWGKKLR